MQTTLGKLFLKEFEEESKASRNCLERVPDSLFAWKPHEKSMPMGYLALIVAEVPRWASVMLEQSDIDFGTFKNPDPKTMADLLKIFDENMAHLRPLLEKVSDEELAGAFNLKANGKVLMSGRKDDTLSQDIRHLVHHRGQLTVYLRLNNIPVPSIYGPSADDKMWSN